tara:strand:+ start:90 stop:320 length:231 start_codon:yes stop_codon:yes gene_type:complete
MSRAGRKPSRTKSLKNGYYFSISGSAQSLKPIRLMRSSKFEIDIAKKVFKNRNYKYLGEVKDNVWQDGENKGKKTN